MKACFPRVPDGHILYAIGDIHGHAGKLRKILTTIAQDAAAHPNAEKQIIFLGDYIDRGPDSKSVIDIFLHDLPAGFKPIFLRGNHEDMLLRILAGDTGLVLSWLQFGGEETSASYGVDSFRPSLTQEMLRQELLKNVSAAHKKFLLSTVFSYQCGDYFFAHAGARPGVRLDAQDKEDLMWIFKDFLSSTVDFDKMIIHGHNATSKPDIQPNRIGIDTGAYAMGHLTCLKLFGDRRAFLVA